MVSDPYQWVAQRNANLKRDDIEWYVSANGEPLLRDRADWSARRAKEIEAAAERDRQQFNHRQQYPIQDAAE